MSQVDTSLLFRDLTQLGLPKSHFSLINNDTAYNYNPDRFNFYVNLLENVSDPNQQIASKVFGIMARNRRQHEKIQEKIDHIAAAIKYLRSVYTRPDSIGEKRNMNELNNLKDDLNSELLRMPIVNAEYEFKRTDAEQKEPEVNLETGDFEPIRERARKAMERAKAAAERAGKAYDEANATFTRITTMDGGTVTEDDKTRLRKLINQTKFDSTVPADQVKKDLLQKLIGFRNKLDYYSSSSQDVDEIQTEIINAYKAYMEKIKLIKSLPNEIIDIINETEDIIDKELKQINQRFGYETTIVQTIRNSLNEIKEQALSTAARTGAAPAQAAETAPVAGTGAAPAKAAETAPVAGIGAAPAKAAGTAPVAQALSSAAGTAPAPAPAPVGQPAQYPLKKEPIQSAPIKQDKRIIQISINNLVKQANDQAILASNKAKEAEAYSNITYKTTNLQEANNAADKALEAATLAEEAANKATNAKTAINNIFDSLSKSVPQPPSGGSQLVSIIHQIGGSYFGERLAELNKIKSTPNITRKAREAEEDDVVVEYKNNPLYSPDLEKVSFTDRLVFIAMTYAFRAITLTLLNSAIYTQYVNTFTKAFAYYFLIYSMIFIIWVLIVNMKREDYIPGLIFYYVNTNYDPTVWWRLIIHIFIQALALPLPILLTPRYASKSETDTYEKRENLYNTLAFFTFVLWFITSLAALRI
jgi:uncharacterized protein YutE (UPF0331/DUF86 family)